MHLEIETKVKIKNVSDLRSRIKKIAKHKNNILKKDEYFAVVHDGYPKKAFRIRFDGSWYVVNFKKHLMELSDKEIVVKEEYEINLGNKEHFENFMSLLSDLKFEKWIKKEKKSEIYLYNKDKRAGIEINNVKKLGWFLEIEYLCSRNEVERAKKVIREILLKLGIDKRE
ncbi:class IV adenylate cyclase [Candidatus Pacearchaeota archaeon]|nr:class IV adenylate cyclase [Candidatus Pacearchaeota archaeon]